MRYIFPTLLILIGAASFMLYTNPTYKNVKTIREEAAQYEEALANSRKLQEERDALSDKYRSIDPNNLNRLNLMLPDSADNIRLLIDMQRMAASYGLSLDSVEFGTVVDPSFDAPSTPPSGTAAPAPGTSFREYGTFPIDFSVTTDYETFLRFLSDLESNLRLMDVESISLSADPVRNNNYKYSVTVRTYWLKD